MPTAAPPRRGSRVSTAENDLAIRGTWLAIAAIALLMTVVGAGLQVRRQADENAILADAGTLGGITATLRPGAGWLGMDGMDMSDNQVGYQMPAQMMPGAPEGDDMRLGVPLTLVNTGGEVREFNLAEEFSLGGGRNDQQRKLHSDTFGLLNLLAPGNAIDGVLYFDTIVPGASDAPLYLLWNRDGQTVRLAIPVGPGTPHDEHDS